MSNPIPFTVNQGDNGAIHLIWENTIAYQGMGQQTIRPKISLKPYKALLIMLASNTSHLDTVTTCIIVNNESMLNQIQLVRYMTGAQREVIVTDTGIQFSQSTGKDFTVPNGTTTVTLSGARCTAIPIRIYGIR